MSEVILVVDDDSANLMLAQKILGGSYRVAAANSGAAAFKYLEKNRPDLILLDINMPQMSGFEAIQKLKSDENYSSIPVIFLTADKSVETETKCFQAGAIDFVGKPFVPDILISRVRRTLELERYHSGLEELVKEQTRQLKERAQRINEIQNHVIVGMANLIESRDGSTGKHVKNTQLYVTMIVDELKNLGYFSKILTEEYIQNICKAAPLHDIGKIKIPDSILQKPGRLTEEEFQEMKKHTEYSMEIIRNIIGDVEDEEYVKVVSDIALYHHERWDGTGYPKGLAAEQIPLCARIMAVADVFDALYEERCYKSPVRPVGKVLEILEKGKGSQFDPVIVDVFAGLEQKLRDILGE
ncbi:MAG: response regulator [Lachnospiraceae bacterium]|nr:response regulator [Lachnospiraceae bacterium]